MPVSHFVCLHLFISEYQEVIKRDLQILEVVEYKTKTLSKLLFNNNSIDYHPINYLMQTLTKINEVLYRIDINKKDVLQAKNNI